MPRTATWRPPWARRHSGRVIVAGVFAAYFVALWGFGGADSWERLGVRPVSPSFADMRSVTSAWECAKEDVEVLPRNPCDPILQRPANYPRLWLAPAFTGIGQRATVPLGILTAAAFFVAFLYLVGGMGTVGGLICGLAFVSPAAMLGIERGNVDLLLFAMLVAALTVFRRGGALRVASYGLLLLAAMLKLFPVFAWGVLLRQPRRWMAWSVAALGSAFGLYVVAIRGTIEAIQEAVPQGVPGFYGADVGVDALQEWASSELSLAWPLALGDWLTATLLGASALLIAALAWRWRGREAEREPAVVSALRLDAFVAGAGIYVGSFVTFHSYDYRLIFLLLTLPQLLDWCRADRSLVPLPRLTVAALIAAMWSGEPLSAEVGFWTDPIGALTYPQLGLPIEELFNWFVFLTLATGLVRVAVGLVAGRPGRDLAAQAAQ